MSTGSNGMEKLYSLVGFGGVPGLYSLIGLKELWDSKRFAGSQDPIMRVYMAAQIDNREDTAFLLLTHGLEQPV